MNRLVLFSFYDEEGIADEYVYYLLKELQTIASKLVIIINGDINITDKQRMQKFAAQIIQRPNEGYDAGAYKDAIFNHLSVEGVMGYDELILCNDTFYGPLVSFDTIWASFEKKDIDFWGLHLWDAGYLEWISSFFLVFRKKIVSDERFYEYWIKNINEKCSDIKEVYATFETGLFYELCGMGYQYDVYAKKGNYHIIMSPDYAIRTYRAPFLKKKVFASSYYCQENVYKALTDIDKNSAYDINFILKSALRKYSRTINKEDLMDTEDIDSKEFETWTHNYTATGLSEIKKFCDTWKNETIYIYGAGVVAVKLYILLRRNIRNFGGFIVSTIETQQSLFDFPIYEYEKICQQSKCVIVALSPQYTDEIRKKMEGMDRVIYTWEK